jgi:hypothetical protein
LAVRNLGKVSGFNVAFVSWVMLYEDKVGLGGTRFTAGMGLKF